MNITLESHLKEISEVEGNKLYSNWIVIKEDKQFSKKPFKVIHRKRTCLECFHNQFCYTPLFSYIPILKEWIKRYSLLDPTEDKCLPFTEELIFVLFNFFGTHGKCL